MPHWQAQSTDSEVHNIEKPDVPAGSMARFAQRLGERVPLGGGDLSQGMPVFVPRWVVWFLRLAAISLALYFAWRLFAS